MNKSICQYDKHSRTASHQPINPARDFLPAAGERGIYIMRVVRHATDPRMLVSHYI